MHTAQEPTSFISNSTCVAHGTGHTDPWPSVTPGYFRAVNIALHALNALLVFYLALLLGLAAPYAVLAGAFFALFPASVEAVAWVASRSTVLSTAFLLCSVIFYVKYAQGGGRRRLLLRSWRRRPRCSRAR